MATRICRHCGVILEDVKASDFKLKVKCEACGNESVFLSEAQANRLIEKRNAANEIELKLQEEAKAIEDSLPSIPIMAYKKYPGFSSFLHAVALGIQFPPKCTEGQMELIVKKAKADGAQYNPYVFESWSHDKCWDFWSSKIPAHPNLIGNLLKFNICTDFPITSFDGERIEKYLLKNVFECPYCSMPQGWGRNTCIRCKKNISNILYLIVPTNNGVRFKGILSEGYLKIANGPTYKYVPHSNSWSGYAAQELYIPGELHVSSEDVSQVPIIHFGKTTPTLLPQELKCKNKYNKSNIVAFFFSLLIFCGVGGVHRLYVGRTITGIVQLLTFGGFIIWQSVDIFEIIKGRFIK